MAFSALIYTPFLIKIEGYDERAVRHAAYDWSSLFGNSLILTMRVCILWSVSRRRESPATVVAPGSQSNILSVARANMLALMQLVATASIHDRKASPWEATQS